MKEHSERLGKEPIPILLAKLAIPAVVGMLVMSLFNVVDAIFISRAVGTVGIAAVAIAFPVSMIIMATAGAIGIGGASLISRMLGANKLDEANQAFGNILSLILVISIVGILLGLTFLTPILYLFGSSETILPYAQDYVGIILYGTVLPSIFKLPGVWMAFPLADLLSFLLAVWYIRKHQSIFLNVKILALFKQNILKEEQV